jgi:uncharacterized membrane protein
MRKVDLHWLAGYLEGEGCFGFRGSPRIQVLATDKDTIERAAWLMKAKSVGVREPVGCRKQCYRCQVAGDRAIALMEKLLPLMHSRRRARIKEVLRLAAARPGHSRGSRHYNAKLTEADIPVIRRLQKGGTSVADIAAQIGAPRSTIYHVVKRESWAHVPEEDAS